jgi:membrane protein required for colicin V production
MLQTVTPEAIGQTENIMNLFDISCMVIIGFCLIRGIFRGLVKEVSAIVGVIGGFYGAYTYYPNLGVFLGRWISTPAYLNIVSFMAIFCGVLIAVNVLGIIIKYLLNVVFFGWLDRFGGAVFGVIKGALIVSILFIVLTTFLPKGDPLINNSVLSPHVAVISEVMATVISQEMKQTFALKIEELNKVWKNRK